MQGVDDQIVGNVLRQHGRQRLTVDELWRLCVAAGGIREAEALEPFKHEILRKFYQRRNRDLELEGNWDQILFPFTRKTEDGEKQEYHQEWGGTTVGERYDLYARERKKWENQGRKARAIYDHAANDFGKEEGRRFTQRALKLGPPPEVTAIPADEQD